MFYRLIKNFQTERWAIAILLTALLCLLFFALFRTGKFPPDLSMEEVERFKKSVPEGPLV